MRDVFEDLFATQPFDPTESARRSMRARRRRFYQAASVQAGEEGFAVCLDGKPVRTPARRALVAPSEALGQAIAAEWREQAEFIDPAAMPLTRLANSIIDGVADAPSAVAAEIARYLESDLLFYRADGPDRLNARQAQSWDPIVAWAREALGARFILGSGVRFVRQPERAVAAARAHIPDDPWRLGAVHAITTLTGSALIALAVAAGALSVEAAWAAAHVDEDWNVELWGHETTALERRAQRLSEMRAAAQVLALAEESAFPRG